MDFQEDFSGNIGFICFYWFLQGFLLVLLVFIGFPVLFDGFWRKLLVFLKFSNKINSSADLQIKTWFCNVLKGFALETDQILAAYQV